MPPRRFTGCRRLPAPGLIALLAILPTAARAQTWTGGHPSQAGWSFNSNWQGNNAPSNGANVVFAGTNKLGPDLNNALSIQSLTFASGAGAFALGSSGNHTLTIGSGGLAQNSSATQTIGHALFLGSSQTWDTAAGDLLVSGNISSNWITLSKSGSGTLTLSGNNSGLQGPAAINAGTLLVASSTALGSLTYGNTVASGATLALQGGVTLTEGDLFIAGTGSGGSGALRNLSGSNTLAADLKLSASATVTSDAGTLTLANPVNVQGHTLTLAGAGAITANASLNGVGHLVVGGSGARSFEGAQINVNSGGSVTVAGSGAVTFDTTINASDGTFVQNGSGTTTFAGSTTNYFHSVDLNAGNVVLANSSGFALQVNSGSGTVNIDQATLSFAGDNQLAAWTDITLGDGAVLALGDTLQNIDQLVITGDSILDFGAGGSTLDINSLSLLGDSVLTIVNWADDIDRFFANVDPGSSTLAKIIFQGLGEAAWDPGSGNGFLFPGTPIPEPATYGLLSLGALSLLPFLRRRPRV